MDRPRTPRPGTNAMSVPLRPITRRSDFVDADTVYRLLHIPAERLAPLKAKIDDGTLTWNDLIVLGGMGTSYPDAPFTFFRKGLPGDGYSVIVMKAPLLGIKVEKLNVVHHAGAGGTPPTPGTVWLKEKPEPRRPFRNIAAEME